MEIKVSQVFDLKAQGPDSDSQDPCKKVWFMLINPALERWR